MKRFLLLIGVMVLVLAMTSPAPAQFKSWGHMEIATGWISRQDFNVGPPENQDLNYKRITQRYRFYLQYGDPKTVRAVMGFEADSSNWGESAWTIGELKPTDNANPSGRMGTYGTDQVQLELKHAYLDFVIPNTPLSVSAGLQFYGIGGRMFMSKDAPGLIVTANFAPHKVMAYWWREKDKSFTTYEVNDSYGLQYQLAQKQFNVYVYGFYKNDLSNTAYSDHPYWIGVGGGFKPGNLELSGQFIYLGGKKDYVAQDDITYNAWAAEILARYQIGPGMFAAVEGYYSTGEDTGTTDKQERYTLPTTSEVQWSFGNDRSVFYFYNGDFMYYYQKQLNFTGLWYARLNFEYAPLPWVNLLFNYLYIGDTSKGSTGAFNSTGTGAQDKSDVGQELNVIAKIKIYDPLVYNVGFGYFFPGDVYKSATKSPENAWAFLTCLKYVF
ncbi:MAG: hypothetical protein ACUVWV_13415 [Thermodesulfobacteriota bacterium]